MKDKLTLQQEVDRILEMKFTEDEFKGMTWEKIEKQKKKAEKRVAFLRHCLMYLESNPTPGFIEKEIKTLVRKIDSLNDGFGAWVKSSEENKSLTQQDAKRIFRAEVGLRELEKQRECLRFLYTD